MATVININDVLDGHVGLEVECVDRLYLNAYVPRLQVGGQVVTFFTQHRGNPIPSPALMQQNGNRFRRDVKAFAEEHNLFTPHRRTPKTPLGILALRARDSNVFGFGVPCLNHATEPLNARNPPSIGASHSKTRVQPTGTFRAVPMRNVTPFRAHVLL